ncbi:MAG: response regulator RpfG family c-di-GMP phosphodiesterase [Planctomycetota bacterium]
MGGLNSRSGLVALYNQSDFLKRTIAPELRRARFGYDQSVDVLKLESCPYAILVDISELKDLQTKLQMLRTEHEFGAVIAICQPVADSSHRLIQAFRSGVSDSYLAEEGETDDLIPTIKLALEKKRLELAALKTAQDFTQELGRRTRSLVKANQDLEETYEETLKALVLALDSREKATAGHSIRVAYFTCYLSMLLGIEGDELQDIYRGALLHDIGKIGIPDAILLKPGKLTYEEFEHMKEHTILAKKFLKRIQYLDRASDIPYYHHEKWNGGGYPEQLRGENIPVAARIFAVADVYDALRSKRCYKDPMTYEVAVEIISKDAGTHFDPRVAETFLAQDESVWDDLDRHSRSESTSFEIMYDVCNTLILKAALEAKNPEEDVV